MKALLFSSVLFLASRTPCSRAWISPQPTKPTTWLSLSKSHDSDPSASRRKWLTGVTSMLVGASFVPRTANAVSLVSSPAVCDPGVSIWKKDGRFVYLLGTAHISSASATLAGDLVKDVHPEGVFVELDLKRVSGSGILAGRLRDEKEEGAPTSRVLVPYIERIPTGNERASISSLGTTQEGSVAQSPPASAGSPAPAPAPAAKQNFMSRAASAAVGNSIRGMYKKLDSAGFQAGEEFVVAIREGQKIGSAIVLGDRDVEVTLGRVADGLARTDLKALMNPDSELEQSLKDLVPSQVASASSNGDIGDLSDEEFRKEFSTFVETIKAKENVRKVMGQLERIAPALYEALVSERDAYMAAGLNSLDELETIVAVMGVAHVDGVERSLQMNGWTAVAPKCPARR